MHWKSVHFRAAVVAGREKLKYSQMLAIVQRAKPNFLTVTGEAKLARTNVTHANYHKVRRGNMLDRCYTSSLQASSLKTIKSLAHLNI
jgi:hypothetical protein